MKDPNTNISKSDKPALIALCMGFFMIMIDVTAVSVALPDMEISLGDGIVGLEWVMDSYNFSFACLLLIAGRLTDLAHAKTIFLSGIILFLVTSLGSGIAPTLECVVVFRFLQGIASALILPASFALLIRLYPHPKKRSDIIGIWSSIAGIGAALGPVLGAYLSTTFSWRYVFFINIPFGLAAIILCLKKVNAFPLSKNPTHLDYFGQMTSMLSIGLLVFSILEISRATYSP